MNILSIIHANTEIIQTIQNAIVSTLMSYAHSNIQAKPPFIKNHTIRFEITVIGVIRLTNKKNENIILALGFSEETFIRIYENTFQEKIKSVDGENQDLAGELLNIIFQTIDPELRGHGYVFDANLPQVLTGKELENWKKIKTEISLVLPFAIDGGNFYFELSELKEN